MHAWPTHGRQRSRPTKSLECRLRGFAFLYQLTVDGPTIGPTKKPRADQQNPSIEETSVSGTLGIVRPKSLTCCRPQPPLLGHAPARGSRGWGAHAVSCRDLSAIVGIRRESRKLQCKHCASSTNKRRPRPYGGPRRRYKARWGDRFRATPCEAALLCSRTRCVARPVKGGH